ncbi:craniofacial development protein 2-like [Condylostylus longicornis]|uniref:craniofacial development protein 2-like n=1 Tax=Condylostylus longicornis TaxID=2530218 RepID=UPI00244DBC89|nr:craniofacial development protein 2-like [Condylostylus longicornis]
MMKNNLDIIALQEIRWMRYGEINKPDFSIYYSGDNFRSGMCGTGFIVNKKIKKAVIAFTPINKRMCSIRVKGKFNNITIISVYAPTEEANDDEKDEFYEELNNLCEGIPYYDGNGTWKVPGRNVVNQIDHVLISKRWATSIIDVRTYRGANCDSDHFLVKGVKRRKWNTDNLKNEGTNENFRNIVERRLEGEINNARSIDEEWDQMENAMRRTAEEIVGQTNRA